MTNILTNEMPRRIATGRVDLYREIHKGLRNALFTLTFRAGRLDPAVDEPVTELVDESRQVIGLLRSHHEHEEQPALEEIIEAHAPSLVAVIDAQHNTLAERLEWLASRADELAAAPGAARATIAHAYYLELAAFTSAYLAHLDDEERVVMPALAAKCDDAELGGVAQAILASVRPEQQVVGLTMMLPALNPAERGELVGRIRASAPPEAFAGVRAIASQVLTATEYQSLEINNLSSGAGDESDNTKVGEWR
jgi:hypothetical protein